jgi:hypothetical protein
MKKTIKTIGLLATTLLLATSCSEDWLTIENPTGEPLEEYYTTDATVFEALTAAYDPLHWPDWGLGQYNALNIDSEIMGDLFWVGGSNIADMQNWHKLSNFQGDQNNTLSSLWTVDYSGIKRCNDVIKYIGWADAKGNLTAANKASYLEQARVLRVFYYNMLWHYFGNVPYYLTDLTDPYTAPQLKADEVYKNIIAELEDILKNCSLPMRWDSENAGRVSKAMAYMLYAEMVMYQNDESRFEKALGYMNEIIADTKNYSLNPSFAAIWAESGEWCQESIWEINYNDNNNERGWSWPLGTGGTVLPTLIAPNSWPGGDGWAGGDGWGFLPVRVSTYNMYDAKDTRRDATCWDTRGVNYSNRFQDTHIWLAKYRPFTENNADAGFDNNLNYNNNYRYYRFSETLLNAAELMVRTGKGNAKPLLSQVRKRAGLGEVDATLDNIITERKLEFVGEGKRYWDLVRMEGVSGTNQKASLVLVPAECDGTNPSDQGRVGRWTPNKKYIPIAQGELDSDPALVQNTEYFK